MVTKRNNNNSSNRKKASAMNHSNSIRGGRKHETETKNMYQHQRQHQLHHQPQRNNNNRYNNDEVDPFPSALRCRPNSQQLPMVLDWYCPRDPVPVHVEQSLIDVVLPYGAKERGMFKEQPDKRLQKLKNYLYSIGSRSNGDDDDSNDYGTNNNSNNTIICLYQALSLRRHHMKQFNTNTTMAELRLGSENDINESARIFENCIEQFLIQNNIQFYNEQYQKSHIRRNKPYNEPYPPTPDFILQEPITIRTYRHGNTNTNKKRKMILQEHSIHCKYEKAYQQKRSVAIILCLFSNITPAFFALVMFL